MKVRCCLFAALLLLSGFAEFAFARQPSKDKGEDSPIVAKSRKKLDAMVTHEAKDQPLQEMMKELCEQAGLSFRLDPAVPKHKSFSINVKEKPLKEALADLFKGSGLGFVIHRKKDANDRYEGYLEILQGDQRGDDHPTKKDDKPEKGKDGKKPAATKPAGGSGKEPGKEGDKDKGDDEKAEKLAAGKLKLAKMHIEDGAKKDAIEALEELIKKHPKTKAAAEAKELLAKLKK